MLKIFQLVFRKVNNFSVIFFEAKLSLSVCIPAFSFNLIISVYLSPNVLTFNLVSTIEFKIILLSNGCLQFFLFICIFYLFLSFFFNPFFSISFKFFFPIFFSVLLFRSFFSILLFRSFFIFLFLCFFFYLSFSKFFLFFFLIFSIFRKLVAVWVLIRVANLSSKYDCSNSRYDVFVIFSKSFQKT